jgi:IclR family transcriptional regulator, acetate operon repressor
MRVVNSLVERCFLIVELLADEARSMRLGAIAERLDLGKSVVHRMLTVLCDIGWVEQDPDSGVYGLTLRLAVLGQRFLSGTHLPDVCQPILEELAGATRELARMAVVQSDSLTWIAQAQGAKKGLIYQPEAAAKVRLSITANGKAWLSTLSNSDAVRLAVKDGFGQPGGGANAIKTIEGLIAELEATRLRGWAISNEEAEAGVVAIAAPILLENKETVGTVSVAGPTSRLIVSRHEAIAADVIAASRRLGELWPLRRAQEQLESGKQRLEDARSVAERIKF